MSYGFEAKKANGDIIVSTRTSDIVLKLIAHGTVTSASGRWASGSTYDGPAGYRISIPQPPGTEAHKCMVFIQPLNRFTGVDAREATVGVKNPFWYITDTGSASFKYLIFYPTDVGLVEHDETWGFELFDDSGNKTFSSNQEIMDILGVVQERRVQKTFPNGVEYTDTEYYHEYCFNAFYCLHMGYIGETFSEFVAYGGDGFAHRECIKQISTTDIVKGGYPGIARDSNYVEQSSVYYGGYFGCKDILVMEDPLL